MNGRRTMAVLVSAAAAVTGLGLTGGTAAAAAPDCTGPEALASRTFRIQHADGAPDTVVNDLDHDASPDQVRPGDTVTVTFTVRPECAGTRIGMATYRAQAARFDPNRPQSLYDADATTKGGTQSLTVDVPRTAAGGDTAACPNPHKAPEHKGKGANTSGAYDSTCDGRPSDNGVGGGKATGRPCAGCVGNADDKNPPGQAPDGTDGNNGYECDGNKGIARENPAHTSCKAPFFQLDLFTGETHEVVDPAHKYNERLIDFFNGPN